MAGKWAEWYPDVMQADGSIGVGATKKYLWQEGWWSQHQRLLKALSDQTRKPIVLQGDLHILSYGLIQQSGDLNFEDNPIHVIGTGPLGSGNFGFPSKFRDTPSVIPDSMKVEEALAPLEKNGFTIIEITPQSIRFSLYAWRPDDGVENIETLAPILVKEIK